MLSLGVKETSCTVCSHVEVCANKEIYLGFLKASEKFRGEYPDDISFIKKNDPACNFFSRKASDVVVREGRSVI